MKKILFAILTVSLFTSCLDGTKFSQTLPIVATFEYSNTDYAHIFGADSLYFDEANGYGPTWQYYAFRQKVDSLTKEFKGGMMLSCLKGSVLDPLDSLTMSRGDSLVFANDRFRVNSKTGHALSATYVVFYGNPDESLMPAHDIEFLATQYGTSTMGQCFVNNTGYVAYKVAQTFQNGDVLTLKARGYKDGAETGSATINLAEFTAQKDSIVSTWTAFDLTKLGDVEYVDFEVLSTKEDVPAYFCMDSFLSSVSVSY